MREKIKESIMRIKSNRPLISVQDIVKFIDKGEKYLKLNIEDINDETEMEVLQGIVLSPDYQRIYRSSVKEESSIIESLLVGIPIPEIFLVISGKNEMQIRHVMDGQHRLNAIYRYINNKFPLKSLDILGGDANYEGKKFSELDKKDKIKILGSHLSILEFESFEDSDTEIELFKRYNRNTKPLEIQEIEMATYFSETSKYISHFINTLIQRNEEKMEQDNEGEDTVEDKLFKIYNITKSRNDKQKNHQEICVILSILESGLQENVRDGVTASKRFLERKSKLYKSVGNEELDELKIKFNKFNNLALKISEAIEYPFSTSMINEEKDRQSKFLMGVSIVLATISYYFDYVIENEGLISDIKLILSLSPIADISYKASSTNMKNVINYLFLRHQIHKMQFTSLNFLESKISEVEVFEENNRYTVPLF
ncbi:DUF262 domain-containing protein [Paenibacillus sp. FSL P2-0136]|uniref:DUF262 domain-containing protein n=1 Tax=unclassified Paenibacillus TaxID=185978 RepID=UPI0030DA6318